MNITQLVLNVKTLILYGIQIIEETLDETCTKNGATATLLPLPFEMLSGDTVIGVTSKIALLENGKTIDIADLLQSDLSPLSHYIDAVIDTIYHPEVSYQITPVEVQKAIRSILKKDINTELAQLLIRKRINKDKVIGAIKASPSKYAASAQARENIALQVMNSAESMVHILAA